MRNNLLSILLGLTATIAVHAPLPVKAEAKVYQFVGGKESINLDASALEQLQSLGLSLASVENTAEPAPGYTYAFNVIPASSDSNAPASNFTFSYDDVTQEFIPLGGTVDLTGSIFFNVDTTKLALPPQLEIGDLFAQPAIDLNVIDKANTGLPVFTLVPTAPVRVDLQNQSVTLNFTALVAQEFSDFLVAAGADTPIAGLNIGEVQGDRNIALVPEPSSALAILMVGGALTALKLRRAV
ncbi:PEP-CTERM sorting domain-containing protein [Scytonema sp. UIC 10036]|uniref:PEP-CTERM sorting domain-containing protein n=1 Tax=Scytonema sp. UIC 10036 TaxID=2304196 RepID=UPI0012DABECF|nr:PEP-CTERM sorting domain-containing protein [Scytonema sp. UIC 10036]MUH01247.1 PEP-CTERM sorting domain-containing protein [Scytonema sp. UIC 10036]